MYKRAFRIAKITTTGYIYTRLENSGILYDYIVPSYDVLHTFSFRYLMEDLTDYMCEKGVLSDRCLEEMWKEYDEAEY